MTPQNTYKFVKKSTAPFVPMTQAEIAELPPPPQEWLNAIERGSEAEDAKQYQRWLNWKEAKRIAKINEDKRIEKLERKKELYKNTDIVVSWSRFHKFDFDTQLSIKVHLGAVIEEIFDYAICNGGGGCASKYYFHLREWNTVCSKLMNQKNPRKETKYKFGCYINHIRMAVHERKEFYFPPPCKGRPNEEIENIYTDEMIEELVWKHFHTIWATIGKPDDGWDDNSFP